jgi:hypothetical protein
MKRKRWSEKEINILREVYPLCSNKEILDNFPDRGWESIRVKANSLNIHRRSDYYTETDEQYIIDNYNILRSGQIAKVLGRSIKTLERKARSLGLLKQFDWTKDEISYLKQNFGIITVKEIANGYLSNRTEYAIHHKSIDLRLQKTQPSYNNITNEELLSVLSNIHKDMGRTPTKEELGQNGIPSYFIYVERFGTYSNACSLANVPVNGGMYNFSICYSKNGDMCWSNSEKAITDFFIDNHISFEKEIYYSQFCSKGKCGYLRCDWMLGNDFIVEYFGLMKHKYYRKMVSRKRNLCSINNIELLELTEKDINNLNKIFCAYM